MSAPHAMITLREPTATDRERLAEIVATSGVFRPAEVAIALEVFDDAVAQPGQDYLALGAFDHDRLVGFTLYGPTPGTIATWDLYWIAVDPALHRNGIGRQLMAATEDGIRARRGQLVVVETSSRVDYAPTRTFYEALGYTRAAKIGGYYAPHDDLIVYTKFLIPQPER